MIKIQSVVYDAINSRYTYKISIILLFLLVVGLFIQTMGKALRPDGYDFTTYYLSARALIEGTNPYQNSSIFPYIYPLSFAFFITPLALFSHETASVIWFLLSILALFGAGKLIYLLLNQEGYKIDKNKLPILTLILLVVLITPVQNNLLNGQVNIVLLFLCAAFFYYLSLKKIIVASIFLAMGISIKLVPGLLIILLIFRKQYKAVFLTLLLTVLFLLIPVLFTGKQIYTYYNYYISNFILFQLKHQHSNELYFNLSDVLRHLFYINVSLARALSFLIGAGFIVIAELGKDKKDKNRIKEFLVFSIYLLVLLLLSPTSQKHYLVYMFPAVSIGVVFLIYHRKVLSLSMFWLFILVFLLLWLAKIDDKGPFFFLTILMLLIFSIRLLYAQYFRYDGKYREMKK